VPSTTSTVRTPATDRCDGKATIPDGKYGDLSGVELTLTCRHTVDVIGLSIAPLCPVDEPSGQNGVVEESPAWYKPVTPRARALFRRAGRCFRFAPTYPAAKGEGAGVPRRLPDSMTAETTIGARAHCSQRTLNEWRWAMFTGNLEALARPELARVEPKHSNSLD